MDNSIVLKEEELEDVCTNLSENYVDVSSTGECINHNFSGAVNAGLLGDSVGIVSKQMNSISQSIGTVHNLINQYYNQMIIFDKEMINKINEINIPQELLANNSLQANSYTQLLLGKLDGKSVNIGKTTQAVNEIKDSIINEQELKDIHGNETIEQIYDDRVDIDNQESLSNITGNAAQEFNDIEDNTVNKTDISDISGDETEEQYYNDVSHINNQNELSNMNSNYVQENNEITDDTDIKEQSISNEFNNVSNSNNNNLEDSENSGI